MLQLRYSEVPVVVAPAGLTLGGGMEIALHGDRVQAATETYMGLVEVGVGLIPAGGGTKEMLVRAMAELPTPQSDPLPYVQKAFETVALAKVSASGPDGVRLEWALSFTPTPLFFIDWRDSPHPAASLPDGGRITRVEVSTPEPNWFDGVDGIDVVEGPWSVRAWVGDVELA